MASGFWRELRRTLWPEPAPWAPLGPILRPSSFAEMPLPDLFTGQGEPLAEASAVVEDDGGVRIIASRLAISTDLAVEYGIIPPPPGWKPPVFPVAPLRRRLRGFVNGQVYRARIALANRLAGFDVEERD